MNEIAAWLIVYLVIAAVTFGVVLASPPPLQTGQWRTEVLAVASILWPLTLVAAIAFGIAKRLDR